MLGKSIKLTVLIGLMFSIPNVVFGQGDVELHKLRVKKCTRIIESFYNYRHKDGSMSKTNFLPYIEYFISYHERLEKDAVAKGKESAKGFGDAWYWSTVYGGANFSMSCYSTAPGSCAGPLDVKHSPLVLDPKANIRFHCNEMFSYYTRNNVRGINLCKWVMLPSRPTDWGGGRFSKTDAKFKDCINKGYKIGKLP